MTITETTPVGDIVTAVPSSIRVFERHGVDFCCGGRQPLAAACEERGLSLAAIEREIEATAATDNDTVLYWADASLEELTGHIVATYHESLRTELPHLVSLAARVQLAHGARAPRLLHCVDAAVRELSTDLLAHMVKEEQELFPAIRALERRGSCSLPVPQLVAAMESEHDRASQLLTDLRAATDDFTPPDWACAATRALYQGLAKLEADMHIHVHLENNVLFPRALELARATGRASEDG